MKTKFTLLLMVLSIGFMGFSQIYVDIDATGANDGTSWANAYTNLNDALGTAVPNNQIWVAEGIYKPGNARLDKFIFNDQNLKVYGGFSGTETLVSERNHLLYKTILSGDLNGNDDNSSLDFNNPTKAENSLRIAQFEANNIEIYGLIFDGGHANGSTTDQQEGSAFRFIGSISSFKMFDCEIRNQVNQRGGAALISSAANPSDFRFERMDFNHNLARFAAAAYIPAVQNTIGAVNFTNSKFTQNETKNLTGSDGLAAVIWARSDVSGQQYRLFITNCTIANNSYQGGTSPANGYPSIAATANGGGGSFLRVYNTVMFNNSRPGGNANSVGTFGTGSLPGRMARNSFAADGYGNIPDRVNTSASNPSFMDASNGDFTLNPGSQAINFGDVQYLGGNSDQFDLVLNNRISGSSVDIGAYEFQVLDQTFVNKNATGNNDGTSWANAYTDINMAVQLNPGAEIWVAAETYYPGVTRSDFFNLTTGVEIYGGFNGTETMRSQRDVVSNPTILSGDIDQDDNGMVSLTNTTMANNSENIVRIAGNNVILDGVIVERGYGLEGSAINVIASSNNFILLNSIVRENMTTSQGAVTLRLFRTKTFNIDRCNFNGNVSRVAADIYAVNDNASGSPSGTMTGTITNSIFENSKLEDNGATAALDFGVSIWFRNLYNVQVGRVVNCTFTNLSTSVSTASPGNIIAAQTNNTTTHPSTFYLYNSIFWNNTDGNGNNLQSLGKQPGSFDPNTLIIRNSLSPDSFNTYIDVANVINTDPMFVNAVNDYRLQNSSPAREAGDNALIVSGYNLDVVGNPRIETVTVDMGAYENLPDPCDPFNFVFSNINQSSVQIDWQANPVATSWDVAYHVANQPFSSAQFINGLTTTSAMITGLNAQTEYTVYVRGICNGTPADYVNVGNITTTQNVTYVAFDATGGNNGSTWADAYTDLNTALVDNPQGLFWVKAGSYNPGSNLTDSFLLGQDQRIYGGFVGTETNILQRDPSLNQTILSGDVSGNDVAPVVFGDASLSDNNFQVIRVSGSNIIIDGFTISGGNSTGSGGSDNSGSAILVNSAASVNVVNSKIINNTGTGAGAIKALDVSGNVSITVQRTLFDNNVYTNSPIYYGRAASGQQLEINFESCLFTNNESRTTGAGTNGALFWTRQDAGGTQIATFINNTIADNILNNGSPVINSLLSGGSLTTNIYNTIFWNNLRSNGNIVDAIQNRGTIQIRNSISNNGFTSISDKQQTNDQDPLFNNVVIETYELGPSSPAINMGDNQYLNDPAAIDIYGEMRIVDTTVDIGATEFRTNPCDPFGFVTSLIGSSSFQLDWQANPIANSWDVAYHESSQAFSTAIVLNGFTTTTATINGLSSETEYKVYVRSICNGVAGDWVLADSITTARGAIYVAFDATGNNDGSSWSDAYTDLNVALAANPAALFWVKQGSYVPGPNRGDSFNLTANQILFGGFSGTEISDSQRDPLNNITRLSGDINGNDSASFSYTDPTRSDNSYRILELTGSNVIVDGFYVSGANANGSASGDKFGGITNIGNGIGRFDLINCVVENNSAESLGLIRAIDAGNSATINFDRVRFTNNAARGAVIYYSRASGGSGFTGNTVNAIFTSCLFNNNETVNTVGANGDQSVIWFRQENTGRNFGTFTNCTFADNTFAVNSPVIRALKGSATNDRILINVNNSIFWDNETASGAVAEALTNITPQFGNGVIVRNSLDTSNFSNISDKQIIQDSNPQFLNASQNDYALSSNSSAINFGDNMFLTANDVLDLNGEQRIKDTTVDIGAFEFEATLSLEEEVLTKNILKLYPNPATNILNIKMNTTFVKAEVYNLQGQKVLTVNTEAVSVINLASGLYLLRVTNTDGAVATQRFVKR